MNELVKVTIGAGAVIKQEGKYLLVQESKASAYGKWNLPAGRVHVGETIEAGAVREVKEETGYEVELVRKLGIWQKSPQESVLHAFEAKIMGGHLEFPKDEFLDVRWLSLEEILAMREQLRHYWVLSAIGVLEGREL